MPGGLPLRKILLAGIFIGCCFGGSLGARADFCRLRTPHPANTFFKDEPVRFELQMPLPRRTIYYTVYDYYGQKRAQGALTAGGEQPVMLNLPSLGLGFYRLYLRYEGGSQDEPFCVIPRPYEDPGDYALFAMHHRHPVTAEFLEVATQAGVRLIRLDASWPPLEPKRGLWRMELLADRYELCKRYGVQALLILGYTPPFIAEKPVNDPDAWLEAATFTWHPTDSNEFGIYLEKVFSFAHDKTMCWPRQGLLPPRGGPMPEIMPWLHSVEMWNEADLYFYYGDWNRYLDFLRICWAASRYWFPASPVPVVYGGSTGNFTGMGVLASGAAKYAYDYLSLHPGGDLEEALRVFYSGAQQIPWCVGAPREIMHTECYAQGRRGTIDLRQYQETPEELQRCYLTMKAWREAAFFRSDCLGGIIGERNDYAPGTAMLRRKDTGGLAPTPLYPAFAAARYWLSDAVEVGPIDLGPGITAHVFLKKGDVLLAAWADDGAEATIKLSATAKRVDPFGRATPLQLSQLTTHLNSAPLVLWGASASTYLPQALLQRYELFMRTSYATPQINERNTIWYAKPMQADLYDILGKRTPEETLNKAILEAAQQLQSGTPQGLFAVIRAQEACLKLVQELLQKCPIGQEIPRNVANNLWRLSRMEEWLGEIADARSLKFNNLLVSDVEIKDLENHLLQWRSQLRCQYPRARLPLAEHLLDRASWQLWRLKQFRKLGTYTAIWHKIQIVQALQNMEKAVVLQVVPLIDFKTALQFRKTRVLTPGQTHTFHIWVYNYLKESVKGELKIKFPAVWTPSHVKLSFSAPAGRPATTQTVRVSVPGEPRPWIVVSSITLNGPLPLALPPSLSDRPIIEVTGRLSTGEELCPMSYFLNVGQWTGQNTTMTASLLPPRMMDMFALTPSLFPEITRAQAKHIFQQPHSLFSSAAASAPACFSP